VRLVSVLIDLVRLLDTTVAEMSGPAAAVGEPSPVVASLVENVTARHREFEIVAARISQGATRFALLQRPPVPDADLRPLVEDLQTSVVALLHLFRVVRPSEGVAYRGELQSACVGLLSGLAALARTVLDKEAQVSLEHIPPYLFNTGMIWKAAELFPKLPRTNRHAAMTAWEHRQQMISDAISELEALLKRPIAEADAKDEDEEPEEDDMPLRASEHDKVKLGLSLVRLTRLLGRKLATRVIEPLQEPLDVATVEWLDQVVHGMDGNAAAVDDLSVALYPRHDTAEVESGVLDVSRHAQTLLDLAATVPAAAILTQSDIDWFAKVREHVHTTTSNLVAPSRPAR